jgi:Sec-independent protein translocase protein TatA
MFGFGEILVLASIVVVVLFARRLPDMVRAARRSVKAFREELGNENQIRKLRDVGPGADEPPDHRR